MAAEQELQLSVECVDEPHGRPGIVVYGKLTWDSAIAPRVADGHDSSSVVCFHRPAQTHDDDNINHRHDCVQEDGQVEADERDYKDGTQDV